MTVGANCACVSHVLTKMKWETSLGAMDSLSVFCVDCCKFEFKRNMTAREQYSFLEFVEGLNLNLVWSWALIGMWLHQNDVPFTMKFRWSKTRPVRYNLSCLFMPRKIQNDLNKLGDESIKALNLKDLT